MKKLVCFVLAMMHTNAFATRISVRDASCPIGDSVVKIYEKIAANTHGGFDSDLVSYSSQGQFREYAISTCRGNRLSLYGFDMVRPWTDEELAQLERALEEHTADLPDDWGSHAIERYRLAGHLYESMDSEPLFLAELYLQASWTARDSVVGVITGLEGPMGARTFLEEGTQALDGDIDERQRTLLLHNLTRVAHRGGFIEERDTHLAAFASLPLTESETEVLETMRWGIEREIEFQDLAISAFTEGLESEELELDDEVRSTYLLADLLRRRARVPESLELFARVLAEEDAPEDLRAMAQFLTNQLSENGSGLSTEP